MRSGGRRSISRKEFAGLPVLVWLLTALAGSPAMAQAPAATETVVHNFGGLRGTNPYAGLTADSSGNFYGTTSAGGIADLGVVFKLDATRQETVLHNFTGGADGAVPYAGLIFDAAGNLYGTTDQGGAANLGVVYKVDAGGQETVLYSFAGGTDGANPQAGVIFGADGNLYGTTSAGGSANAGTVFKLDAAGHETVLYTFTGGGDGADPLAGLVFDPVGNLYGTTYMGGTVVGNFSYGVVFKLDPAGQETVLYSFTDGNDGGFPGAGLARDPAGNLYGTTQSGGLRRGGVVFRLDAAANETVLYNLEYSVDGSGASAVILDASGNIYGTSREGGADGSYGYVFKLDTASHMVSRYNFIGGANGWHPYAGVILDSSGNLYGTTFFGGADQVAGNGVVYKMDAMGQETVLFTFTDPADGIAPSGGVVRDAAGDFFGTASYGGESGQGVVFKIDATGLYSVLHSFTGVDGGSQPFYGVIEDSAGTLYGTASGSPGNAGVVVKLDAKGLYAVLHRFTRESYPSSGVIRDTAGNLYGTTEGNGANCTGSSVYKLDAAGNYTVLYSFTGGVDGCIPLGGLIRDAAGNLYGTTLDGGASEGGTVFKLEATGRESVLHSFACCAEPYTGLARDSAGNLYGTTRYYVYELAATGVFTELYAFGAALGNVSAVVLDSAGNLYGTASNGNPGLVYKLDATRHYAVLHNFTGGADGGFPSSGLTLDLAGDLYGTTTDGGNGGNGVVFRLRLD
jgi:uncharacterized repeat protein (TIGR03803 family)